jgi:EmrB/QacA subfamily drug resistance transporter
MMLCTALVALDATIVATAVPSIVGELGGLSQFPWLFSVYLVAQAVTTPLYGKLADQRGRKPVIYVGIGFFLLGSALCGVAWNMASLIAFRVVQGMGAGAVQATSLTVVGDLYSIRERARVQGYIAGVWAVASVLGPAAGGLLAQHLSWRWIFFINLPLGAVATWMILRHFHEQVQRRPHRLDVAGAALLTLGCGLLLVALLEGGVAWEWGSGVGVLVCVTAVAALVAFVVVERRAAEPVVPLWLFRRRALVGGNLVALSVGALLMGLTAYVPVYAQGVLGVSPVAAGFAVASVTIGWPIAAGLAGHAYLRLGFRDTSLIGGGVVLAAVVTCGWLLRDDTSLWVLTALCCVLGAGLGLASSPTVVAVQSVVGWEERGVVTAVNMFGRSFGSALGAAACGATANATIEHRLANPPARLAEELPRSVDAADLLTPDRAGGAGPAVAEFLRQSLYAASHHVFLTLTLAAVLLVLSLLVMPRRLPRADRPR